MMEYPLEATRDVVLEATATIRTSPAGAMTEVSVDVSYDLSATMGIMSLACSALQPARPGR